MTITLSARRMTSHSFSKTLKRTPPQQDLFEKQCKSHDLNVLCGGPDELPDTRDMPIGRLEMTDGDAKRQASPQPRVRDEDVAAAIHELHNTFVHRVELSIGEFRGPRPPTETDDTERHRREPFEIGIRVHPRREILREPHVSGERLADLLRAIRPQNHPQLQRSEAPPELDARVHQILYAA